MFIKLIMGIEANGSTALYDGVNFGASEIRKNLSDEYINRIVLLSDGLANVGPQSTEELSGLGKALSKEDITVTTIGVGLDYNEDLMTALAQKSGGNSYFAKNSGDLPKIFSEEINEAMTLMARNIQILLECSQGAIPVAIIGREGDIDGKRMKLAIKNVYGKNEKYALFELGVPEGDVGIQREVARINLTYLDPYTKQTMREQRVITINYDNRKDVVKERQNKEIVKEAALTKTSEIKQQVISLVDQGKYNEAAGFIKNRRLELEKTAKECDNDSELLQEAQQCEEISRDILANKGMTRYRRKRVMNDVHTQTSQQYCPYFETKKSK